MNAEPSIEAGGERARLYRARGERLRSRGVELGEASPRLREALAVATGERRLHRQEPTDFHYPGLADIPFFDPADFPWAPAVEAATPAIAAELRTLLARDEPGLRAYIQDHVSPEKLGDNRKLLGSADWSVLFLCENGWLVPSTVDQCPKAWATLLEHVPMPRIAGWGPTVMFSVLKAGARIAAHTGMTNTRLICHLPLVVPPGCGFRVGNEVRHWEEGRLMIFDDTIEHEAWNDSDQDRIVLIFDIWRPELSERERFELLALLSD